MKFGRGGQRRRQQKARNNSRRLAKKLKGWTTVYA